MSLRVNGNMYNLSVNDVTMSTLGQFRDIFSNSYSIRNCVSILFKSAALTVLELLAFIAQKSRGHATFTKNFKTPCPYCPWYKYEVRRFNSFGDVVRWSDCPIQWAQSHRRTQIILQIQACQHLLCKLHDGADYNQSCSSEIRQQSLKKQKSKGKKRTQ